MTKKETSGAIGTLEQVDPNALRLDGNVRTDAVMTKQFIASVRANGVLVPILAVRGEDGAISVRAGQRRTLAAREVGLPTVPVWVIDAEYADANQETIDRIVTQIVENDHRSQLSASERVRGIQQLLDAGMSMTATAKTLAHSSDVIKAAKVAAGSQVAMEALDSGQLTLAEAAVVAEFEDDPDAVKTLVGAAQRNYFDHAASQMRVQRETAQARELAAKSWVENGFTVLASRPSHGDKAYVPMWLLQTSGGQPADASLVIKPELWAVMLNEEPGYKDTATGERVDEDDIDWSTDGDPEAKPEKGLRHADSVTEVIEWVPDYYCLDVQAAGLSSVRDGAMSESAAESNQAADDEAVRQERRKVLALNKLGAAAQDVRREFVRKLLSRKTPPKGAAIFVASTLAEDPVLLTTNEAIEITHELLGLSEQQGIKSVAEKLPPTGDGRAQVITLGLVVGALEARTPKYAWRASLWLQGESKRYLEFLTANGYELSPVEKIITGKSKADKVYADHIKAVKAETE